MMNSEECKCSNKYTLCPVHGYEIKPIEYGKTTNGSYLHNCFFESRAGDPEKRVLSVESGKEKVALNGYAIIPLEEYYKLLPKDSPLHQGSDGYLSRIAAADIALHGDQACKEAKEKLHCAYPPEVYRNTTHDEIEWGNYQVLRFRGD